MSGSPTPSAPSRILEFTAYPIPVGSAACDGLLPAWAEPLGHWGHGNDRGDMAKQSRDAGKGRPSNVVKKSAKGNQKGFYAMLGLVAAVLGIFIIYQVTKPKTSPESTKVDPSIPLPKAEGYLLGKEDAPVQVLEFADFECPACGQFYVLTEPDVRTRLIETGEISYRFLDYPLPGHRNTWAASHAAACANEQGKFWEMHDRIFQTQQEWSALPTSEPYFAAMARQLALDLDAYNRCIGEHVMRPMILADIDRATGGGAGSTPTFFVGSQVIAGAERIGTFRKAIGDALAAHGQ